MPARPLPTAALGLVALLCVAPPASGQNAFDPNLEAEIVVTGLDRPTAMAFLGPGDFLFLESESGRVRRVLDDELQATVALDVPVSNNGERGLLGIAIAPGSPQQVFLYYTESSVQGGAPIANRVYRYEWNAGTGLLENPSMVLELPASPGFNHNGGTLTLGPPGLCPGIGNGSALYVIVGDLLRNGQLENFPSGAPPDDTGAVFRICQDGSAAPGNPFTPYCSLTTSTTCTGDGDCPGGESCVSQVARYWAYGIRNGFGLAIDPLSGSIWDTENGPSIYDEVNLLPPGTNSGWEVIMGPDPVPSLVGNLFDIPGQGSTYSNPEFSWLDTIAPTAILFPVGSALGPAYDDVALVGDFLLAQIYAFPLNGARDGFDLSGYSGVSDLVANSSSERDQFRFGSGFGPSFGGVTDLKLGPDGNLYVVSIGSSVFPNGSVFRVRQAVEIPELGVLGLPQLAFALLAAAIGALRLRRAAGPLVRGRLFS